MKKLYHKHKKKINYLIVGVWNTVFGYLSFVALYYLFSQRINYMFLVVFSNILSITNAYIGYKIFVFKTKGNYLREYLRFYVVYAGAIAINLIFLPILVEIFGIAPVIAQGGIVFVSVLFSYFGHSRFSFRLDA